MRGRVASAIAATTTLLTGGDTDAVNIAAQVAEKLAGKKFNSFDHFRQEMWKEVAKDPALSRKFGDKNLVEMQKGHAPFSPRSQQVGGRKRYELDHNQEIKDGGNVYDMNNIIFRTPLNHLKGK